MQNEQDFHIASEGAYTPFSSMGLGTGGPVHNGGLARYYVPPSSDLKSWAGSGNACGVTAFVTLLRLYGKFDGTDPHAFIKKYWADGSYAPDIGWGGPLGTSWQRLTSNFRRFGLRTVSGNENWFSSTIGDGKWEWLLDWVNNGFPVAVTLCTTSLGDSYGGHWAIVREIKGDQVMLENMGYDQRIVKKDRFLKAWEAHTEADLPFTHYASVVPFQ